MQFRVLGPLEVSDKGKTLPIQGSKQRAVLGHLLLNANRVVSVSALMDVLWPLGDTPNSARKILHNAVWGLRGVLAASEGTACEASLVTRPPGYVLQVALTNVDLFEFRRLAGEGQGQLAAGSPEAAAGTLRQALGLWRGDVLADLVEEGFTWPELAGIDHARTDVLEDYFDAELALGRHHSVLREIEAAVEADTLRERLCGQLMLALYRCGRHTEALGLYIRIRERLVGELGLEPGQRLQELQQAVLRHDESLCVPEPARTGGPRTTAGPLVAVGAATLTTGESGRGSGGEPQPTGETRGGSGAVPWPAGQARGEGSGGEGRPAGETRGGPDVESRPAAKARSEPGVAAAPLGADSRSESGGERPDAGFVPGSEADEPAVGSVAVPPQPQAPLSDSAQPCSVVMVHPAVDSDTAGADGAYTEDDAVEHSLDRVAQALRDTVDCLGGTVVAPAGPALLAVFTGTRAPERAISAALAMLACLSCEPGGTGGQAIGIRATVATGEAHLYRFSKDPEAPAMVGGPVADTCRALLARTVAGTVRVCATTRARTSAIIAYGDFGSAAAGWRVRSAHWRALTHPSLPIVDRESELDVLARLFGRSRHRAVSQLVTVLGGAGAGKTRLVLEFERRAMARWDDVHFLVSGPEAAARPLGLLRDLLLALCDAPRDTDAAEAAGHLRRVVYDCVLDPGEASEIEACVTELIAAGPAGPAPHRTAALRAAGRALLRAVAAQRPLVIFVDDGHELDEESLDFLESLVGSTEPPSLMVVLAARPQLLDRRPTWGSGQAQGATLTLAPLSDAVVDRLSDIVLAKMRQGLLTFPTRRFGDRFGVPGEQSGRRKILRTLMRLDASRSPQRNLSSVWGLSSPAPAVHVPR
ncbi:BTAD domain-containing putative transcriptional regulator [Streptomyces bluensis]|uniref:BTAD domain-containing putative transcriptional regulator n=1 Tax=Streptomyces bluensis TaxID=33897 RepID=UPI00367B329C